MRIAVIATILLVVFAGCSPKVGSEKWDVKSAKWDF